MTPADPKPQKRIVDKDVVPDGPQACALTGTHSGLTRFHLISRAQGGDDVPENMIWVESFLHDMFHSGSPAQRETVGMRVREVLTDEQMKYVLNHPRGGEDFLDRKYPRW